MNLVYMAKPTYGGWIQFTVHLSMITQSPIYKITKRSESKQRSFGFELHYQNKTIDDIVLLPDLVIVALDKHYQQYLPRFPEKTKLVIHDPTEVKPTSRLIQDNLLSRFSILTIRDSVKTYLQDMYSLESHCMYHPFYKYPRPIVETLSHFAVSTSRIDYDKHIDISLKANKLLPEDKKIWIYGKENRLCVYHKLAPLGFHDYWKGPYEKRLQICYKNKDVLQNTKFMVDLSTIHKDGGGTQYTFLDAIYNRCVLILHREWIDQGTLFNHGYNCFAVQDEHELVDILVKEHDETTLETICDNAMTILDDLSTVTF